MTTDALTEITEIIKRYTKLPGTTSTANGNLELARHSSHKIISQCPQTPVFGMVVQGSMSVELGEKTHHFGVG